MQSACLEQGGWREQNDVDEYEVRESIVGVQYTWR